VSTMHIRGVAIVASISGTAKRIRVR
jgi:hypothetical protein